MFSKLNPRERFLALLIIVLVPFLLLPLLGFSAYQNLADKRSLIRSANDAKDNLELNRQRWMRAEERRNEMRRFSLSSNLDDGRSAYQNWLLTTANEIFGSASVRHMGDTTRKSVNTEVYTESSFDLSTTATLGQLLEFLDRFENLDCLHRVSRMSIVPVTDVGSQSPTKQLKLNLDIDALAVAGADVRDSLTNQIETTVFDLADYSPETRETWRADILKRNVFGLPNNPPRLSTSGTRRFTEGDKIELAVSARDEDEEDKLRYELVDSPMEGVTLRNDPARNSATLIVPSDLAVGRYQFTVAVHDDGFPAKSDQAQYSIEIEAEPTPRAPEPPEPAFDPSVATYVTGIVRDRAGIWKVFVDNKPEGELLELVVGDEFEVGSISGIVLQIVPGRATFEIDGEIVDFRPGQVLNENTSGRRSSSSRGSSSRGSSSGFSRSSRSTSDDEESEEEESTQDEMTDEEELEEETEEGSEEEGDEPSSEEPSSEEPSSEEPAETGAGEPSPAPATEPD